jgi:hypothetical protein
MPGEQDPQLASSESGSVLTDALLDRLSLVVLRLDATATTGPSGANINYFCDVCHQPIANGAKRYHCLVCFDFDVNPLTSYTHILCLRSQKPNVPSFPSHQMCAKCYATPGSLQHKTAMKEKGHLTDTHKTSTITVGGGSEPQPKEEKEDPLVDTILGKVVPKAPALDNTQERSRKGLLRFLRLVQAWWWLLMPRLKGPPQLAFPPQQLMSTTTPASSLAQLADLVSQVKAWMNVAYSELHAAAGRPQPLPPGGASRTDSLWSHNVVESRKRLQAQ